MGTSNGTPVRDLTREELRSALRWLVIATVVLYAALAILGTLGFLNSRQQRQDLSNAVFETNTALCALRDDLQRRVDASRAFIEEHPNGVDGLTPTLIEQRAKETERSIEALSAVDCPPQPPIGG